MVIIHLTQGGLSISAYGPNLLGRRRDADNLLLSSR